MTESAALPTGPYKAYDLLTNEYLGGYALPHLAHDAHPNRPITTIYRPSKRRAKGRTFP